MSARACLLAALAVGVPCVATAADAPSPPGPQLPAELRQGGYVILMRHASSPREPPDASTADPANPGHERQLDAAGRDSARDFGDALRRLRIPLGEIWSSPTYRARETLRLAGLAPHGTPAELGDSGTSMAADASGVRGAWLRARVAEPPAHGTDTLIVTHFPNIREAFPQDSAQLADGEALILRPDGRGGAQLVTRVKIEQWPRLAAAH